MAKMVISCVEYFELKSLLDGRVDGWMEGWMDGWIDGWESQVKDCLKQPKMT